MCLNKDCVPTGAGRAVVRINKITIYRETDADPDLSWLGFYSDKPGPEDRTIDRLALGEQGQNERRYFIAAISGETTGNPESVKQDYQRMERYNQQQWCVLGIYAEADVTYADGMGGGQSEYLSSSGLWGIESDLGEDYMMSVEWGELAGLRSHLKAFGVDCSNFVELAAKAERKGG